MVIAFCFSSCHVVDHFSRFLSQVTHFSSKCGTAEVFYCLLLWSHPPALAIMGDSNWRTESVACVCGIFREGGFGIYTDNIWFDFATIISLARKILLCIRTRISNVFGLLIARGHSHRYRAVKIPGPQNKKKSFDGGHGSRNGRYYECQRFWERKLSILTSCDEQLFKVRFRVLWYVWHGLQSIFCLVKPLGSVHTIYYIWWR